MPTLRIEPVGRLGNQMFQYMVALRLRDFVDDLEICGYDLPEWGLQRPGRSDFPDDAVSLHGRLLPLRHIALYMRAGLLPYLHTSVIDFNVTKLKDVEFYRNLFAPSQKVEVESFGPGHIVVNVRAGDILGNLNQHYAPIPLSFIRQCVMSSNAQPVFLGELGDDPYSEAIRREFPEALFRPSRGPLSDFQTLRSAHQLVVAVSTFSWLAAWLSRAEVIHFPVSGMFNPSQLPHWQMLPDESRYRFYEFGLRHWTASPADFAYLWESRTHRLLTHRDVADVIRAARREWAPKRAEMHRQLVKTIFGRRIKKRLRIAGGS